MFQGFSSHRKTKALQFLSSVTSIVGPTRCHGFGISTLMLVIHVRAVKQLASPFSAIFTVLPPPLSSRTFGSDSLRMAMPKRSSHSLVFESEKESTTRARSSALLSTTDNTVAILLLMNLVLLAVGTVMDMTPAVLVFTPIFLPVATGLGLDPVHFGIILVMNLCIGLCTPPVGSVLFVGCGVGGTTIGRVTKPLLPFFIAMVAALLAVTYWPQLALWLPAAFGY